MRGEPDSLGELTPPMSNLGLTPKSLLISKSTDEERTLLWQDRRPGWFCIQSATYGRMNSSFLDHGSLIRDRSGVEFGIVCVILSFWESN